MADRGSHPISDRQQTVPFNDQSDQIYPDQHPFNVSTATLTEKVAALKAGLEMFYILSDHGIHIYVVQTHAFDSTGAGAYSCL